MWPGKSGVFAPRDYIGVRIKVRFLVQEIECPARIGKRLRFSVSVSLLDYHYSQMGAGRQLRIDRQSEQTVANLYRDSFHSCGRSLIE